MARYCDNCGSEVYEGNIYCEQCGVKIGSVMEVRENKRASFKCHVVAIIGALLMMVAIVLPIMFLQSVSMIRNITMEILNPLFSEFMLISCIIYVALLLLKKYELMQIIANMFLGTGIWFIIWYMIWRISILGTGTDAALSSNMILFGPHVGAILYIVATILMEYAAVNSLNSTSENARKSIFLRWYKAGRYSVNIMSKKYNIIMLSGIIVTICALLSYIGSNFSRVF